MEFGNNALTASNSLGPAEMPDFSQTLSKLEKLNRIECGDPLVDLRLYPFTFGVDLMSGAQKSDNPIYLRHLVAEKLAVAQSLLPDGMQFKIFSAWRSRDEQRRLFNAYAESLQAENPNLPLTEIKKLAGKFVAPPDHEILVPPHGTGGAVDLTIVDSAGQPIEMGVLPDSDFKYFSEEAGTLFFEEKGRNEIIRENRALLRNVMGLLDFCFCQEEFWDFNFGNDIWAISTGRGTAIYGYIEP